jgi:hypothetical protein
VRLDAINTIPQSTGTTAQGIALATFTFNNPKSQLVSLISALQDLKRTKSNQLLNCFTNMIGL